MTVESRSYSTHGGISMCVIHVVSTSLMGEVKESISWKGLCILFKVVKYKF